MSGNAAYVELNSRLIAAGDVLITTPPSPTPVTPLLSVTPSYDIGAGNFQIAFTGTPLAAAHRLVVYACITVSASQLYVQGKWRRLEYTSAAKASPYVCDVPVAQRFGTLQVGQIFHWRVAVLQSASGLMTQWITGSGALVSTP